jgi:hypothetical protein
MRTVRLARVAAQAEILLLRRMLTVVVRHAIFGAVAAVFAIAALVGVHVAGVLALEQFAHLSPLASVAIVLAVDLVIAVIFGLLASGKIADPVADEARRVRDQSLEQARQSLTLASMLAPATRLVAQTGVLRMLVRAATGARRARVR